MALAMLVIVIIATCLVGRYPRLQTAGILVGALLLGMTLGSRQGQQLDVEWPEGETTGGAGCHERGKGKRENSCFRCADC